MIVDTSALVAILLEEAGHSELSEAMAHGEPLLPAPVVVEFHKVAMTRGDEGLARAGRVLAAILAGGARILPFTAEAAAIAAGAIAQHGTGNGRGGSLNLLDLMVFATARDLDEAILCTGRDFAAAGARVHPASRA